MAKYDVTYSCGHNAYVAEDGTDEMSNAENYDENGKPVPFWIINNKSAERL